MENRVSPSQALMTFLEAVGKICWAAYKEEIEIKQRIYVKEQELKELDSEEARQQRIKDNTEAKKRRIERLKAREKELDTEIAKKLLPGK